MGVFDWFRGRRLPQPTLDSLRFATDRLALAVREDLREVWRTPDGDEVSKQLSFRADRVEIESIAQLRESIVLGLADTPVRLVEAALSQLDGLPTIRVIRKGPQKPSGMTYAGSLTLGFRDFAFVIQAHCIERGVTGIRETFLLDRALEAKTVVIASDQPLQIVGDWQPGAERHDASFPDHPLSRLRRILRSIESSCSIDPVTRRHRLGQLQSHSSSSRVASVLPWRGSTRRLTRRCSGLAANRI